MVVGVTGKYCAGKNAVSEILSRQGFSVIDVDKLGHRALDIRQEEVAAAFGPSVIARSGGIDRRALARLVFRDPAELRRLEAITHPVMVEMVRKKIAETPDGDIVVNAAILFQMGLHRLCDRVFWVRSSLPKRVMRGLRRDHLPLVQVVRRIWAQRELSPQPYRNLVDIYTVGNSGPRRKLESLVLTLVETGRD